MRFSRRYLGPLSLAFVLSYLPSCMYLDNYMLGKDNTPKPTVLQEFKPKYQLTEQWTAPIGKAMKAKGYFKLQPVVQAGVVYTANVNGTLQATNSQGQVLWAVPIKEGIVSGPTVMNGLIAIGTDSAEVIVLSQKEGKELWRQRVSSDVIAKPIITGKKVLAKTIDGNLYAFQASNGEKVWFYDHGSPNLILRASSSPVVFDKVVLVGYSDGKLEAVDLNTGNALWQRGIAYANGASDIERLVDIDADPIVRGNMIYLATYQGYAGALSLQTGEFAWQKPASTYKNLAMDSNTLYLTDSEDTLWAFDARTGNVKWKQQALKARGVTQPVLMRNKLVVGDGIGYLHVFSTQDGRFLARTKLQGPVEIAPTVSSDKLYVVTANGKLTQLSLS